jgi:hypothetical protein
VFISKVSQKMSFPRKKNTFLILKRNGIYIALLKNISSNADWSVGNGTGKNHLTEKIKKVTDAEFTHIIACIKNLPLPQEAPHRTI